MRVCVCVRVRVGGVACARVCVRVGGVVVRAHEWSDVCRPQQDAAQRRELRWYAYACILCARCAAEKRGARACACAHGTAVRPTALVAVACDGPSGGEEDARFELEAIEGTVAILIVLPNVLDDALAERLVRASDRVRALERHDDERVLYERDGVLERPQEADDPYKEGEDLPNQEDTL